MSQSNKSKHLCLKIFLASFLLYGANTFATTLSTCKVELDEASGPSESFTIQSGTTDGEVLLVNGTATVKAKLEKTRYSATISTADGSISFTIEKGVRGIYNSELEYLVTDPLHLFGKKKFRMNCGELP